MGPDTRQVYFTSLRAGSAATYRVSLDGGQPSLVAAGLERAAPSPDGKLLAVTQELAAADAESPDDSLPAVPAVIVVDAQTGEVRQELRGSAGTLAALAFTPSGKSLLAGGSARVVFQWELGTAQLVRRQEVPETLTNLCVSPDGQHFFTAAGDDRKSPLPNRPPANYTIRMWPLSEN
jgi:WD40 repeat protein